MGCGPSYSKSPCDSIYPGPNGGTELETYLVSSSFVFCMVDYTAEWPDYYCIVDMRTKSAYDKNHIVGAHCYEEILDSLSDYMHEMIVVVYGISVKGEALVNLLRKISSEEIEPAALYILEESFDSFKSKYRFALSDFEATVGQFPGPVEIVPKTKEGPALYTIHRHHFIGCKHLISYLRCVSVLNVSSKRLFVKTPGIQLQNVQFEEGEEPFDEAISTMFELINAANNKKGNVLIIDEPGCDYGVLLCGWYLVKERRCDLETVCEHLTNKSAELDSWYTDLLREWVDTR